MTAQDSFPFLLIPGKGALKQQERIQSRENIVAVRLQKSRLAEILHFRIKASESTMAPLCPGASLPGAGRRIVPWLDQRRH